MDIIDTSQCLNCEVLHGRSTRLDFTSEEIAEGYFLDAMRPWPCTTLSRNSNCCKLEEVIQETSRQGWGRTVSEIRALTPYESDRKKWSSLLGVNLVDGESYQIAVQPTINQDKVIPDSFQSFFANTWASRSRNPWLPTERRAPGRHAAFCRELESQLGSLFRLGRAVQVLTMSSLAILPSALSNSVGALIANFRS